MAQFDTKDIVLTDESRQALVRKFYDYFADPREFELFLKTFLESIGLQEIEVTKYCKDGGIDLKALRPGIGALGQSDDVVYHIHAKRYDPQGANIGAPVLSALRGTLVNGETGIIITTTGFANGTDKVAIADKLRPLVLIDGISLVNTCVDNGIAMVYTPSFSKEKMDAIMQNPLTDEPQEEAIAAKSIERMLTMNDVRARILPIPRTIFNELPPDIRRIRVHFQDGTSENLNINRDRLYFAGISSKYKKFGIILADGTYNPKNTIWTILDNKEPSVSFE